MCRVGKVHKAAPATKSALQGPQSTAPATKSPLQGPQVLHLPPNLHFKVTKYCTCYEICTSRPTKYCTRHDMCTSQGPRSTAPATTCALQGPQNIAPAKKLALPGLHLLRNLHFKVHKVYGALPRNPRFRSTKYAVPATKSPLQGPQVLHLPPKSTAPPRNLPQTVHFKARKIVCLPRNLHFKVHKALEIHLPSQDVIGKCLSQRGVGHHFCSRASLTLSEKVRAYSQGGSIKMFPCKCMTSQTLPPNTSFSVKHESCMVQDMSVQSKSMSHVQVIGFGFCSYCACMGLLRLAALKGAWCCCACSKADLMCKPLVHSAACHV